MKKGLLFVWAVMSWGGLLTGCTADHEENVGKNSSAQAESVQEWIYEKMSQWYLWNEDVREKEPNFVLNYERFFYSLLSPNRNDGKHDSGQSYYYSTIERTPVGTRSAQSLEVGFGFEFGLVARQLNRFKNDLPEEYVYAIVTYVYEGSPAWNAGIRRGHCIGKINGVQLTVSNYETLYPLLLPESYTGKTVQPAKLSWYSLTDSGETYVHPTGLSYDLADIEPLGEAHVTPVNIEHNPIFHYEVMTAGNGAKVGYLVYNAFDHGYNYRYDDALKRVFNLFKTEGVNELVLDLRYNGGGYVSSCQLLASMIVSQTKSGTHFKKVKFNQEVISAYGADSYDTWLNFLSVDQMNGELYGTGANGVNLNLDKVYVLATDATASASENLIHCLRGADIMVYHIGTKTEGKNVGVHLIGPETGDGGVFDGYEYRIWPVSFYCYNAKGSANFEQGFVPDYVCDEYQEIEWKELGDKDEALFSAALHHIENGTFPLTTRSGMEVRGNSLASTVSSVKFNKKGGTRIEDISALFGARI